MSNKPWYLEDISDEAVERMLQAREAWLSSFHSLTKAETNLAGLTFCVAFAQGIRYERGELP